MRKQKAVERSENTASYIDKARPGFLVEYFEFFWPDIASARAIAEMQTDKGELRRELLEQKQAASTVGAGNPLRLECRRILEILETHHIRLHKN